MPDTVYAAREGQKFNTDTTLVVVECYSCKITYAIPKSLHDSAVAYPGDDARGWKLCCPLGHTWWYTGTNAETKLKREQERSARLRAELDQTEATLRGQRARATRFKNDRDRERKRVAAGVCPCCKRSFSNLARHMEGQHPGFAHDHAGAGAD